MQPLHKDNSNPYSLTYLVIPDYVYKDSRLTLIQLKVYGFIHSYTNPFYFGNENLAEMFNCSERSITEALAKLEEYGYISMKHTPKAGGGTTRLAVDCLSDSQSSSSRRQKNEATTRSAVLHKDIKDNNIKGNEEPIGNNLTPSQKRELKEQRRKASGLGYRGRNFQNPTSNSSFIRFPKRGGVADGSEII